MLFDKVAVVGLGYIGLPTAAVFAARKKKVIGIDVNVSAVNTINSGNVHIVEPELDIVVRAAVEQGYLRASTVPETADAFLIAVPTPFKEDYHPDLSYIEAASKAIAPYLRPGNLVILESTSPVGATEQMAMWLAQARPDLTFPSSHGQNSDIRIAHCPERVLPGHVLRELISNDRIIGGLTPSCSEAAVQLYKTFTEGQCIVTDARTAEMCKLTENSFRDVNIAFANELSLICDSLGINVWELIRLANHHPRVNILQPGPGVGGHCIAVDPWFIVSSVPEHAKLIRTAREVNDHKPEWVLQKIDAAVGAFLQKNPDKTAATTSIACLGLAFKPDIDDLRESPAMHIATSLATNYPGKLYFVEPYIEKLPASLGAAAKLCDFDMALDQADIIVLLVDHTAFKNVSESRLKGRQIIDTRGVWTS
ncbi:UDP-N-acetyl-D-mannosamine dehydrogenase [Pseudomonas sp. RIT-PI-S]|uniref:UDP-N-acetyl-D-mannosamine dehydrogenase n=1 Tax=Pseudomonas sp. RIT-PI-S TaxID=3035295 RepID=UPI0021D8C957|nr:UDP-N-acetyl-D-mannosamine dehydrogenase [Pseudomonas sp. RIT-PI-S]